MLDPVTRPNGKLYQPRKIRAEIWYDRDSIESQVVVLGTHNLVLAGIKAGLVALSIDTNLTTADPVAGWWRSSIRNHEPFWDYDTVRGAAGVLFQLVWV